jgi:hypothetical protein
VFLTYVYGSLTTISYVCPQEFYELSFMDVYGSLISSRLLMYISCLLCMSVGSLICGLMYVYGKSIISCLMNGLSNVCL